MNKIITYQQNINIPEFFNLELNKAYKDNKQTKLTFIQTDLLSNLKNSKDFFDKYNSFMDEWDLPYAFFPYYVYFNKLLPNELGKPNPKYIFNIKNKKTVDVITQPAYGFLILNVKKMKSINFNFNIEYSEIYYLQDMVEKCYQNNLWISNCYFIDRHESWKDLKQLTIDGKLVNVKKYNEEKEKYNKLNIQYSSPQVFIESFKRKYNI